jgi:adenylylsulfate kinase
MKILVCGLPGSGKTKLANELARLTGFTRLNADYIRTFCDDWDFSYKGRLRQAKRLKRLSNKYDNSITDFVAPTEEIRKIFNADILVWMDTVKESKYEDTNQLFEPVHWCHYHIVTKEAKKWAKLINESLI